MVPWVGVAFRKISHLRVFIFHHPTDYQPTNDQTANTRNDENSNFRFLSFQLRIENRRPQHQHHRLRHPPLIGSCIKLLRSKLLHNKEAEKSCSTVLTTGRIYWTIAATIITTAAAPLQVLINTISNASRLLRRYRACAVIPVTISVVLPTKMLKIII